MAVELIGRLHDDFRACLAGSRAVLVDPALDAYMHALGILSPERDGASSPVRPLAADHDDAVLMRHLGVHDITLGVGERLAHCEAESGFQPLECGAIIAVGE